MYHVFSAPQKTGHSRWKWRRLSVALWTGLLRAVSSTTTRWSKINTHPSSIFISFFLSFFFFDCLYGCLQYYNEVKKNASASSISFLFWIFSLMPFPSFFSFILMSFLFFLSLSILFLFCNWLSFSFFIPFSSSFFSFPLSFSSLTKFFSFCYLI